MKKISLGGVMSPGTREFNSAGVTLSHLNAVELFRANDSDQNFRLEKNSAESSKQKRGLF